MCLIRTTTAGGSCKCAPHHHRPAGHATVALLALTWLAGCAAPRHAVAADPEVDFAAHVGHRGLIVDRMSGGHSAVLVPDGVWFSNRYLLHSDGRTIAALWLKDPSHVTVRESADPTAPVLGRVFANWDESALRLTLQPAAGPPYTLGRFRRVDATSRPVLLESADMSTITDVRGWYRAELRDQRGTPVGWLSVRITSPEGGMRTYDGNLPAALDGPLAAAAVELVNADVDDIESHVTDVYLGN
jgi:hypothetical protein